jgi:iron complex outermembrane receptor protein
VRLDASWRSDAYRLECPIGATRDPQLGCTNLAAADPTLDQQLKLKAHWLLTARASLAEIPVMGSTTGRLSAWVRNLTNSRESEFLFSIGGKTVVGTFEQPRTFGVDFSVDF